MLWNNTRQCQAFFRRRFGVSAATCSRRVGAMRGVRNAHRILALAGASLVSLGSVCSGVSRLTADFEDCEPGALIDGYAGWHSEPPRYEWAVVKDAAYGGGWDTHGRYLIVNGPNAFVTLPELDTAAAAAIRISLDVRPGDAVRDASHWGAVLYCYATDGGIVSLRFTGSERPNAGPIQVTNGGSDAYLESGYLWAYAGHDTSYHLELAINQSRFNRTWELRVDRGEPVTGDWGAFFGSPLGSTTLARVVLRGGHNQDPGGLVAFDNLEISGIPQAQAVGGDPEVLYARIAQYLDECYYAAGTRVDLARLDLEECGRQGRTVPRRLSRRVDDLGQALRRRWLALEQERQGIAGLVRLTPGNPGTYQLRLENLGGDTAGESGWFGLRWAAIAFPDATRVLLPAARFKGGAFVESYAYRCEPAPAAFVHGRAAQTHTTVAYFDLPRPPEPGMRLDLSGLDDDKPGVVPIRIALNGITVWEGPNGLRETGWSERSFGVPAAAWQRPPASSHAQETLRAQLGAWLSQVEDFGHWSRQQADDGDALSRPLRQGLVWRKVPCPSDWWRRGFLRGLCFESDKASPPGPAGRPWFDDNFEYVIKALAECSVNLLYLYPAEPPVYPLLAEHNRSVGIPVVECRWPLAHPSSAAFYLDPEAAARDALAYVRALGQGDTELCGLALDEPRFGELEEALAGLPEVVSAFQAHLERRRPLLAQAGATLPGKPSPQLQCATGADRVAWLEWQYFKMDYLTGFYARLAELLAAQGVLLLPIVQDYLERETQTAPYVAWAARLPIVGTDLYRNGSIAEAYALDLLASTNAGRTVLVSGSGYSAKTPDRFQRALANGLVRADGVLNWIYTYAGKYRSRYFFIGPDVRDDRGRSALDNWRPEYWDIQVRLYQAAARADAYLADTESTADLAVLHSMRSVIAAGPPDAAAGGNTAYLSSLMAFNALVRLHRPVDGCMLEGLTAARLQRYRVMYLPDAPALAPAEVATLVDWVQAGGTLVVGANTALQDAWGRPLADYGWAERLGLHFAGWRQGVQRLLPPAPPEGIVPPSGSGPDHAAGAAGEAYSPALPYAAVTAPGATVLCRWDNGDPALLRLTHGAGTVYFLSAARPGHSRVAADPRSGLYGEPSAGWPAWFRWIALQHGRQPAVEVCGAPAELEVQVRRKGPALVVHLLDWYEGRDIDGLRLIAAPSAGSWRAHYPADGTPAGRPRPGRGLRLRPVHIHEMVVLEPQSRP
jgi:hypothetical protein